MKIAILSGQIPAPPFIERLINGVAASNEEVLLFGKYKKKPKYENRRIRIYGYHNRFGGILFLWKYTLLLLIKKPSQKRLLDQFLATKSGSQKQLRLRHYPILYHQPEILHLQWAKNISEWKWTQSFNIRLLLSLRGTHINISPLADAELANEYRTEFPHIHMHAISESMKVEACKWGANPDQISVVHNGLNLSEFQFQLPQPAINTPFRILMVGRSHWVKGYNYALDALHILDQQKIAFRCTIVGAGNDEELLLLRQQYQLESKVEITAAIPNKQLIASFHNYHVMLLPSLSEGIANVAMEAMASGLPVITTNCGGMRELVNDKESGFIVPIRDAESMAKQIMALIALSESTLQQISRSARFKIEQEFNEAINLNQLLAIYHTSTKNQHI